MVRAIDTRTRVVVLCRPHNPTGTLVSTHELDALPRGRAAPGHGGTRRGLRRVSRRRRPRRHGRVAAPPPQLAGVADVLQGLRARRAADRLCHRRVRSRRPGAALAGSVRHGGGRGGGGVGVVRGGVRRSGTGSPGSPRSGSGCARRCCGSGCRCLAAMPTSSTSTATTSPPVCASGISAKAYPDGSARIAVGDSEASAAVLEALRTP